jgi:hypothetical protein
MKKIALLFVFALLGLRSDESLAQVRIGFNIGIQPIWGPVGYDYVDYYFLPDIDVYYDVPGHHFIYFDGRAWIDSPVLPERYRDFDLYTAHKVVINEPRPWLRHDFYRDKYGSFRGHRGQEIIRDSHESKYWEIKEHPEHSKWKGNENAPRR